MIDVMDEASACMKIIKNNIECEPHMKQGAWSEKGLYEELYEVICEIVCVKRRTVKVNGNKSKENDKGHGIENHAFFLWNIFLFIVRILS